MDPLNVGGFLASILGLVFSFRSECQSAEDASFEKFMMSLDSKRHRSLIEEIGSNHLLTQGIKSLLQDNHEELKAKLTLIETTIAEVSSTISGLKEVSESLSAFEGLSVQALSILGQLSSSEGSTILESTRNRSRQYQIIGAQIMIKLTEPKFIEDDLGQLCRLGFLIPSKNSKGSRLFRITRAGDKLIGVSDL